MDILDSFLVRAHIAGVGLSIAASPLGCIVVWRRMAFFGDATAHASILGVALALATSLPIFAGVLIAVGGMAMTVSTLGERGTSNDSLLAVLSHATLATGLVAIALIGDVRIDLMAFLFGDILAVSRGDILVIWAGGTAALVLVAWRWSAVLTLIVSPELARTAGINPHREQFAFNLALALVIAVAIKVVGALLIAGMLVIPAAAARPLSATPERMAVYATCISAVAVTLGLGGSLLMDTPAGPSIVACLAVMFLVSKIAGRHKG